jgi:hypothetical protein
MIEPIIADSRLFAKGRQDFPGEQVEKGTKNSLFAQKQQKETIFLKKSTSI